MFKDKKRKKIEKKTKEKFLEHFGGCTFAFKVESKEGTKTIMEGPIENFIEVEGSTVKIPLG